MGAEIKINKPIAHVVDVLGNVVGRDQPILRIDKAMEFISTLGEDVLSDDNVVFFDPFCKAGEILLACAMQRCLLKSKKQLIDVDAIFEEIFKSGRYFGLAPDERHHRLSLRTFLGNTHSHNEKYNHIISDGHYLSEEDGKLDRNKFEKEFQAMIEYIKKHSGNKKIIAVGNPPYQENYSNNDSNTGANPIYHIFLEQIIESQKIDQFQMVIPSRWFAGGRGKTLKEFALKLRKSGQVKQIYDFQNSKCVFPTVDIKGGVCFIHWDRNHNGKTKFFSHEDQTCEDVDISTGDIIVRDLIALGIVQKIQKKSSSYISDIAWSWNSYGLPSNYFDRNKEDVEGDVVECLTKRGIPKRISSSKISKNSDSIKKWKVAYPKAVSKGGIPHRPDQIFILKKGQICTETYMIVNAFETKEKAEALLKYLQTDFVRFLVSIKKITQDMTKDTWCLVPNIELDRQFSDDKIYKMFSLGQDEINYIKKKVKGWS